MGTMADAEAHVCMECGHEGYGGWNCGRCGGHRIAMTGRDHPRKRGRPCLYGAPMSNARRQKRYRLGKTGR